MLRFTRRLTLVACFTFVAPSQGQQPQDDREFASAINIVAEEWLARHGQDFGSEKTYVLNRTLLDVRGAPARAAVIPAGVIERVAAIPDRGIEIARMDCFAERGACGLDANTVVLGITSLQPVGAGAWKMGIRALGYLGDDERPHGGYYEAHLVRQKGGWTVTEITQRSVY